MEDINAENIEIIVRDFYTKAAKDNLIGEKFAHLDLEAHIPRITSFWKSVLLGVQGYKGSPFDKHISLDLSEVHFKKWISIWQETIDEHCAGPIAEDAKQRAQFIGDTFRHKLDHLRKAEADTKEDSKPE